MEETLITNLKETKLDNGTYEISFEIPLWLDEILKERYGKEEYSIELRQELIDYMKEYYNKHRTKGDN